MKQETLEEAAERIAIHCNGDFIKGAKWQQEQMYSEEDMVKAICMKKDGVSVDSIIKQFKKK